MQHTDTAHSHGTDTAQTQHRHSTDTAQSQHSHRTVTAQSQSPPVTTSHHEAPSSVAYITRHGTAATALAEASDEKVSLEGLMSKLLLHSALLFG